MTAILPVATLPADPPVAEPPKARADSKTYWVNGLMIVGCLAATGYYLWKNGGTVTPESFAAMFTAIWSAIQLAIREQTTAPLMPLFTKKLPLLAATVMLVFGGVAVAANLDKVPDYTGKTRQEAVAAAEADKRILLRTAKVIQIQAPAVKPAVTLKPNSDSVLPAPVVRKPAKAEIVRVVAIDVTLLIDGDYVFSKKLGAFTLTPLTLVKPDVTAPNPNPNPDPNPNPNPTPVPAPLTPFQTEIQRLTKAAIANGGTETTGAGVSSVYSLAADAINSGALDVAVAADAVRRGTTAVVSAQKEGVAWAEFSDKLDEAITTLRAKGDLKTITKDTPVAEAKLIKEKWISTFRDIAKGMDAATGFSHEPNGLINSLRDSPETLKMLQSAPGILGNIDLAKLIELIKLIMELFKLFSPAIPLVPLVP